MLNGLTLGFGRSSFVADSLLVSLETSSSDTKAGLELPSCIMVMYFTDLCMMNQCIMKSSSEIEDLPTLCLAPARQLQCETTMIPLILTTAESGNTFSSPEK